MAQPNNHAVGVDNTFRRKLDRGEYLGRACECEQKWVAKGPPVQRKPLKHRDYEVDLESRLGKTQCRYSNSTPKPTGAGYFCSVCKCVVKDSANYLDHINGKKHISKSFGYVYASGAGLPSAVCKNDFNISRRGKILEALLNKRRISSSSVNGSSLDRLTYVNKNCRRCNKKATIRISETDRNKNKLFYSCNDCGCFVGWCLPINPEYRGHQIPREEVPTIGEQVITEQLRAMTEQQREMMEQL
ncbi:unnamed protein product [Camellia sinensis]